MPSSYRVTIPRIFLTLTLVLTLFSFSATVVPAQEVLLKTRPLTPQNIADFGLPADTQLANGTRTVGIGQPVYLEILVTATAVVSDVTWMLTGVWDDDGEEITEDSSAELVMSPLDLMMVPPYDAGDQEDYKVVSRMVLVPDIKGAYGVSVDVTTEADGLQNVLSYIIGAVFVGKDNLLCTLCHADMMDDFNATDHAGAFTRAITGESTDHFQPFCIKCHVVGFDAAPLAVNDGFDDVAQDVGWTFPPEFNQDNWDNMDPALQDKSNVQCESCHGPADQHMLSLGDVERIGVSLSGGNCGVCHDAKTHHVKNFEWEQSGHGSGHYAHHYIDRSGCEDCHNGAGFVMAHDPDYADKDLRATGNEGIACAACHDPHVPGDGPHQLREMDGAPLGNGTVIMAGGDGILCMNCHQSRRDATSYVEDYTGGTFRGPHHGPQADMIAGENAYEYGVDMPSSDAHLHGIENSCVTCHMAVFEDHDNPAHTMAGGHTWNMVWDNGTPEDDGDDTYLVQSCEECHGEVEDFNFGGEDWDRDGVVEGTQHEIEDLIHMVEALLPAGSPGTSWTTEQLGAYYNVHFVEEDGSHGVHNPKYAASLLQAAVGALTGGIDIDCDNLLDTYEMEMFGDLTSQTGDSDADMDGVSNAMEKTVGTDPNLADSDMDGFSDLAELEAGSDPLLASSTPDANGVWITPAVEVGFMPETEAVPHQFQAIDSLGAAGAWMNIGDSFMSGDVPAFQLFSTRDGVHYFFRCIEE